MNDKAEIFIAENTELLKKENILNIIDNVEYKIGQCYQNSDNIYKVLSDSRIKSQVYTGWLIIQHQLPIHHSWVVIENKYLIDLSDDIDNFMWNLKEMGKEDANREEMRELLLDYMKVALKQKHSLRCHLGKASINNLYIGSKCTGEKGRQIFNELMKKYPDNQYLAKGTDNDGRSPLQKRMQEAGLMK